MTDDCPLLREIDAWFSVALDVLATEPGVRRDVLLVLGGPGRVGDVARVTAADCADVGGYVVVYPPGAPHLSLPLTPAFVEATGLTPAAFPQRRTDPAADAVAIESAIAAVDVELARRTGAVRRTGADRLAALRMHAWRHELGGHVRVLGRYYGAALPGLLAAAPDCPAVRGDVAAHVPAQRRGSAVSA